MKGQESSSPNSPFAFTSAHKRHHFGLPYLAIGALLAVASIIYTSLAAAPTFSGGGPQDGQNFVPDLALIDIVGSEALNPTTVNTTTVTLYPCTGATDAISCASPDTSVNFCTSVMSDTTRILCGHNPLPPNTTFQFTVGTGVRSNTDDALATAVTRIFRTGSIQAGSNTTPPRVTSTIPNTGNQFPANGNFLITFPLGPDGNMNFNTVAEAGDLNFCTGGTCAVSLKKIENFAPGTEVCTNSTACVFGWSAIYRELTVNPASNLEVALGAAAPIEYDLCVRGTGNTLAVKNSANQFLPFDSCIRFRTAAVDGTAPALEIGVPTVPANGATGVSPFSQDIAVRFNESLDPSNISLASVHFCADSTALTAGCEAGDTRLTDGTKFAIAYDNVRHTVELDPITGDALAANTRYCFEIIGGTSGIIDISGNAFETTSSANCFTTGTATDPVAGGPRLQFVDADNFKLVIKFNESMQEAELVSLAGDVNTNNVVLECPTGVTVPLNNKAAVYRSAHNELEITGLGLPQDQTCRVTVTNARDLVGNAMDTTNNVNRSDFMVLNSATTGGFLGGGGTASNDFFGGMGGATAATFWERPTRCQPRNVATSKGTSVECEFPAPGALPVGSTILMTFPSGFSMSTGDGNARIVPAAQSHWNTDLNGPESGTVTATSATDAEAKTITLTTAGAAIANGTMVHFEVDRLGTPTTPAENLRITIVAKNDSGVKIGQTINPAPFSVQQGGSLSISGTVCKGTTVGGACGAGDTKIANVKVFCNQMGGFTVGATSSAFMGFQETTTAADGTWSITGLTAGEYSCNIPPDPTRLADVGGSPPFQPITLTNANRTGVDTKYKDMSGTAADIKVLTVNITGGPASTEVDVFCHAGAFDFEFSAPSMKVVTLNDSGAGTTTLRLQQTRTYECGMGPHMAFEQFGTGGPPPIPTFTFMPPRSQKVAMDNDTAITFAVQATNRTITGTVVDGSNNGIANMFVHAEPVGCFDATSGEFKDCHGAFAQTKSDGTFSLAIVDGTYEVGADGPGLPPSTREIANASGANVTGVTLKMVKSSTTVSGAIQDESGNGIQYAHVNAERRTITSGSDACDFANSRPSGGFADSPTDSSGNYTLYTSNGTWCIRAFAPSYGEVGTKTVTVAGSSLSGQNIAATSGDFGTILGTVTKAASAVAGAFVNCYGSNGGNGAQSGADGIYSLKVKTGTYTCDGFAPGIGPLGRTANIAVTASATTTQDFTIAGNPGTITVTATGLTEGFCDARDSTGLGSGAPISNGTATIKAPAGTYTLRCGSMRTGPLTLSSSSVTLTAGSSSAITATVPTLRTVSGRMTDGSNNLAGATVTFTDTTTKSSFKVVTGSQSGSTNNLSATNVPEGVYNMKVTKKGFEPATTTATVSGGNLTLASAVALTQATGAAGDTITFPVQTDSTAYTGSAKVICSQAGKVVAVEIDSTTGNASADLANGSWSCKAVGDNGKESTATTVTVANGTLSGSAPTMSMDTNISGYTAKSESNTLSLSTGGLLKFNDLAVGGIAPEINVPSNALSKTDSSTGKVEMKTDATVADIDPGVDQNVVGSHGYEITPKDANGNKISDTDAITITIPYTDADVTAAGVAEAKLTIASFNTSSQAWESVPTTVDTVNNLLIASVEHFSSFGILGGITTASSSGSAGDRTPPGAVTGISLSTDGTSVTLTWTDPGDSDLKDIQILRNSGGATPVSGNALSAVSKGTQTFTDTLVTAGKTYIYQLRARDTSHNTKLSGEYTIKVEVSAAPVSTPSAGAAEEPLAEVVPEPAPEPQVVLNAGDLVRTASDPAVYYVDAEGKLHVFVSASVYRSWYANFNAVRVVPSSALAGHDYGKAVSYHPGVRLVKLAGDTKVYAVVAGRTLRWIQTEELARHFYGGLWHRRVDTVSQTYFGTYTAGRVIDEITDFNPGGEIARSLTPGDEL